MSIPAGEGAPKIPLKPGYYWAKWRVATEGTQDGAELTPSDNWEIVQVVENDPDWEIHPAEQKALFVFVCGVGEAQWRDSFVWGDFIARLAPAAPLGVKERAVTEEMVNRALDAAAYCRNPDTAKWMRAALTAALTPA
ncbi:hypothetical protein X747_14775 [Mesorhizobium sp. LNJC384A00]|uniref:hypothetical protein n=1 Tax=unclassified Mesorhizobium TaxID=325217 RepID=UPI0003CE59DD|nr:hypothetical protein [Mesorhizobium sp. LNJC384A00]ESY42041.1 hypothetical protein X747_14775 [Mesorhizobium sp. LNJC384A00]